jgi:agmatinase
MATFDPDAAAQPGSGIFGLPHSSDEAGIVLLPVPFDATTSYAQGTADGPAAIRRASAQVDLLDPQFGEIFRCGIHMLDEDPAIGERSIAARRLAEPIIERGGAADSDADAIDRINSHCQAVNAFTHEKFAGILGAGKIPGLVGGEHSTPFGAIRACAEHVARLQRAAGHAGEGLGILHIDAHMDLRNAYEGFRWSHASIMFNVMEQIAGVSRLVQVGIRDFGRREFEYAKARPARITTHLDIEWARRRDDGASFATLCQQAIEPLPRFVYVSFDIDGLDPSLCPHTGTPVPGGLSFNRAAILLETLGATVRDGRRTIVGFDLVEVAPGLDTEEPDWDANVGARILYKLCGCAVNEQQAHVSGLY